MSQGIKDAEESAPKSEPPQLNRSTVKFRKWRTTNGKQETEARRDCFEVIRLSGFGLIGLLGADGTCTDQSHSRLDSSKRCD